MSLTTAPNLIPRLCLSMLPLPKTPSKGDDGIERVKRSLSTKWGIRFPVRDPTPSSPSNRDMSPVEEKISVLIRFLFFKERALDYAIEQFERNAVHAVSRWQFKQKGEPDVLPSLAPPKSALKQDFLRKQHTLSPQAITELTESLTSYLQSVADRVKAGERFQTSFRNEGRNICFLSAGLHRRLRLFQISQSPRMKSPQPNSKRQSASRASGNGCDPIANRDQQRAKAHQFSTLRLTTTQTTK